MFNDQQDIKTACVESTVNSVYLFIFLKGLNVGDLAPK